jgi:hypothetical protein
MSDDFPKIKYRYRCEFAFMMELYRETFGEFEIPPFDPEVDG